MQMKLTITFDAATRAVGIEGNCLNDRLLCFGMLETAKTEIDANHRKAQGAAIIAASPQDAARLSVVGN